VLPLDDARGCRLNTCPPSPRPQATAEILPNGDVLVRVPKCLLLATPLELARAILKDRELAVLAVRRGKSLKRSKRTERFMDSRSRGEGER
jgi:hypothetical protein